MKTTEQIIAEIEAVSQQTRAATTPHIDELSVAMTSVDFTALEHLGGPGAIVTFALIDAKMRALQLALLKAEIITVADILENLSDSTERSVKKTIELINETAAYVKAVDAADERSANGMRSDA